MHNSSCSLPRACHSTLLVLPLTALHSSSLQRGRQAPVRQPHASGREPAAGWLPHLSGLGQRLSRHCRQTLQRVPLQQLHPRPASQHSCGHVGRAILTTALTLDLST